MRFRLAPPVRGALAGAGLAILVVLLLRASSSLFGLEWLWRDPWTEVLAAEVPPDPGIVIVAVNEKSVRTLAPYFGRPSSWTRELMARVIEEAARGGARAIAFDVLFAEEDREDSAGDRRFAAALASFPTVLGAQTGGIADGAGGQGWEHAVWTAEPAPRLDPRPLIPPQPLFSAAAIGTMELYLEPRASVVRHYRTIVPLRGGGWVPSLALATAAALRGLPHAARWSAHAGGDRLAVGDLTIPVDEEATFAIRWHGARGGRSAEIAYPAVDFDRIVAASLQREESPEAAAEIDAQFRQLFGGKVVIVGYTASGLLDLKATPLSATSAGVEIHANALDNLLHGRFNRAPDPRIVFPLIVLAAALFGALAAALHSQAASAGMFVLFAGAWLAATPLSMRRGILAPAVGPALAIAATWATVTVVRFVAEQRRSSLLRATFGRYVSPQVLHYLLENPEKVRLGGERRDLTILFSDIRGFTSISEASEPEEVVEMLNDYLARMVEILLRHGGTLDKFIGDAVMGFWNAPAAAADHPRRAVLCAIEMIEETARLREAWEREGKPPIRIGIGINTGEAVVGNIGSSRVFSYTVIGDTVNLASRLEGKNKDYGTEIIVSESTRARMGEDIPAFYLDEVRVKGKNLPVKIYEVRGRSQ